LQESSLVMEQGGKEVRTTIAELMREVYPAIEGQIGDLRGAMKEIEEDLLKDPKMSASLNEVLSMRVSRRAFLVTTLVMAAVVLIACSNPTKTETPGINTQPIETPAVETPVVEVTATQEASVSQIDQLIFENEIADLTQEQMDEIVKNSYRLSFNGENIPLGYNGMSSYMAFYYGVVYDIQHATNKVGECDWWRVQLITRLQKSEFGGTDEGEYAPMMLYVCDKKGYNFTVNDANDGVFGVGGETSMSGGGLIGKLQETKEKFGNFVVETDVVYKVTQETVDDRKASTRWEAIKDNVMEAFYASEGTEAYTMGIIKEDIENVAELAKNNPPKFFPSGFIIPK
jgi:hypothetical protein